MSWKLLLLDEETEEEIKTQNFIVTILNVDGSVRGIVQDKDLTVQQVLTIYVSTLDSAATRLSKIITASLEAQMSPPLALMSIIGLLKGHIVPELQRITGSKVIRRE